jgi:hypothetical protein
MMTFEDRTGPAMGADAPTYPEYVVPQRFCDDAKLGFFVPWGLADLWQPNGFPPIDSDDDLFAPRRNDSAFARYAAYQLEELIDRFEPGAVLACVEAGA